MASKTHHRLRPALPAAALILLLTAPAGFADGDEAASARERPTRTVTVGKATLELHLAPSAPVERPALAAAFQQATRAHLTGGEPHVTPKVTPVELPGGRLMLALPVELMHTMFVGPAGESYCSDSTVTRKAAAAKTDEEGP